MRSFRDANGDGTGDFKGLTEKLDYLQWLGIDCLWVPPFFTSPLRDGGYDVADYTDILPEIGTVEDFHVLPRRGPPARHPGDHRLRHEPHQRRAPVVPGQPRPTRTGPTATSTSGPTPTSSTRTRGSSSSTPSRRTGPGTRCASSTTGTASSPTSPTSTSTTRRCTRRCWRRCRFWLDMGLDGFRLDAVPYLYERPGTNGENLPETHEFLRMVRRFVDTNYPGRVLLAEANQWPADVVDYFGDFGSRRRRVPHVLPLPGDAAHLHGGPPRVALADLGDHGADPGDPEQLPVGHLPAQPRRADPRDGHRRGPRLHVGRVRQGPADEGQHRHPPPAGPAARQRHQPDGAVHRAAALAAGLAGPLLRRRDRHGRQHLAR